MSKKPSVSAFFPCYNDEKTIGALVLKTLKILSKLSSDYEVIIVEDGSKDGSAKVLLDLIKRHDRVKAIWHKKNMGYGGALKSGLKAATKDLVFYTDGDGQYDVEELPLLLNLMSRDVNFVNGIKMERQDYAHRIIIGNLYNFLVRWLFLLPIFDVDCDFRLIRKSLLDKFILNLRGSSGSICVEMVKRAQISGGKFRQVTVHHLNRKYGKSQFFKPKALVKTAIELFLLWMEIMIKKTTY